MSLRKQQFVPGENYHIYNRGTEKRIIYLDNQDYNHFLYLMYICNTEKSIELRNIESNFDRGTTIIDIGAYCLMPNHFHILMQESIEGGISKYMHKLMTSYSMYFNKKYERTGRLHEGKFKAEHIDNDNYMKYIYSYIHLNPAKLKDKNWRNNKSKNIDLLNFVFKYPFSSLVEYLSSNYKIINPTNFPDYFSKPIDHKNELFEWMNNEQEK